jgi:hypothetical protein
MCFPTGNIDDYRLFKHYIISHYIYIMDGMDDYIETQWGIYIGYNNNQAFYSQASWGKLEMKPHEQKNHV